MQPSRMVVGVLGVLVLLATTPRAHAQDQSPQHKPIDKATIAAYEKLGGSYGLMFRGEWDPRGRRWFMGLPKDVPEGIPGLIFETPPGTKYPDVDVPFSLMLFGPQIRNDRIKELAHLKNLTALRLWGTRVTAEGLKHLALLKNLTILELDPWTITDEYLRVLREIGLLHALTEATAAGGARPRSAEDVVVVNLLCTEVTDAGLKELALFKNLASITVYDTRWDMLQCEVTNDGLKELARFKKLVRIHYTALNATGLKHLAAIKSLAELDLGDAELKDADLKLLAPCENLVSLRLGKAATDTWLRNMPPLKKLGKLQLHSTNVTDAGMKELGRLENLTELVLNDAVTDAGLKELTPLKKLTSLGVGEGITDAGLKHLALLENLAHLSLGSKQATDNGMRELGSLKKLTQLDLSGIDDKQLKSVGRLPNLTAISLAHSEVTDAGLKELTPLADLTELNLYDTKVTDAGAQGTGYAEKAQQT
ncbi:MAG: hypothetical protein K8U57_34275 [Planctomycetes bacterium]|nr:hypothetical protein [Planctomycetota bacterium]